MNHWKSTREIE
ncbi:hypothetical protein SOVF_119970, partial [Spinacia oleracea]